MDDINERYQEAVKKMNEFLARPRAYQEISALYREMADHQANLMEIQAEAIRMLLAKVGGE